MSGKRKNIHGLVPDHCYTCEYRIENYDGLRLKYQPTPEVIGCKLQKADRQACRRWRDDEYTAKKVLDIRRERKVVK